MVVIAETAAETEEFNGKIYEMTITGSPVKGADVMKYYKGGYLEIPVSAKNYLDGDKDGTDFPVGIPLYLIFAIPSRLLSCPSLSPSK
ncbi:hypothetical protein ACUOFC_32195 [Escherichia sp. TWPC-MK]